MMCPKCDAQMESMGYGDEQCTSCDHREYAESAEDFAERIDIDYTTISEDDDS